MEDSEVMTMRTSLPLAATIIVGLFLVAPATAAEPICPRGNSPRADIVWCADLEVTVGCTTGMEYDCWANNGYSNTPNPSNSPYLLKIVQGRSDAAVGRGYARAQPQPGTTGSGFASKEPIQANRFPNINFRYYVRYTGGYVSFTSGHGPQVVAFNDTFTCFSALKFQLSTYSGATYYPLSCGPNAPPSIVLYPNQARPATLLNNRWYAVEVQGLIDTSCSNTSVQPYTGCNGVVRVWLDGTLLLEYTNLNLGGVASGGQLKWYQAQIPEDYYHYGVPPWGFTQDWDNIVISNTGTYIGCANTDGTSGCPGSAENARGIGDASSPYTVTAFSSEAWLGRHRGPDCTGNSSDGLGVYGSHKWRRGGVLQSTITHGLYSNLCAATIASYILGGNSGTLTPGAIITVKDGASSTDCTTGGGSNMHNCTYNGSAWVATSNTDAALGVTLTNASDGGGVVWDNGGTPLVAQWASYGWIYLPSSNNYSTTNLALSGFVKSQLDANGNPAEGYVALTVSGGNWAVGQKDTAGLGGSVSTSTAVTFDTWHEYELMIWSDTTVSLMIDRNRLLTRASLPRSSSWAFVSGQPSVVVGVIDFQGTAPFTAYFDDNVVASASAWSCDGWGVASCPFGAPGSALQAPSNLVVQ
jgi:hypothetical protein